MDGHRYRAHACLEERIDHGSTHPAFINKEAGTVQTPPDRLAGEELLDALDNLSVLRAQLVALEVTKVERWMRRSTIFVVGRENVVGDPGRQPCRGNPTRVLQLFGEIDSEILPIYLPITDPHRLLDDAQCRVVRALAEDRG